MWKLNKTFLNNSQVKEKLGNILRQKKKKYRRRRPKFVECHESSVMKEHSFNIGIKREGISQINNLTVYLKELEKELSKPKASRSKEIIKVRTAIKQRIEKQQINQQNQSWFFEKIKKIDKLLARLRKKKIIK